MLIEGFTHGVMERLGLGPDVALAGNARRCWRSNAKLVLCGRPSIGEAVKVAASGRVRSCSCSGLAAGPDVVR